MVARVEADFENTILRVNYETGASFNTVPAVINAGGQLPGGWRDENAQHVLRKPRRPIRKRSSWEGMITEHREWKTGAEEAAIKLNEEGMKWTAIADLYGVNRKTFGHRITRYKKLKKQLEK